MRKDVVVDVSTADRARLEAIAADRNSPQKHVWRARIVLLTAAGLGTVEIMRRTGKSKTCVWRWQARFMLEGTKGLLRDKTRPSRIPPLGPQVAERVIALTQEDPPGETTHWTAGMMAKAAAISVSSVQRIWRAHGLQPHRVRQFKLSTDPQFAAKLRDIVGLYVNPPAHAIVLSVDEKSQIQALDRTQPGLPIKKGRAGTMTHDYKRNGTTTLFAALSTLDGSVVGQCLPRHRHQEFLKFLRRLDRAFPGNRDLHLIVDNYRTHKHANVNAWLAKHPRFHLHFIPTSSSWLNLVERWFRELTEKAIRRGVFHSVPDLTTAIEEFLAAHNQHPKPFVWTASIDSILAKIGRCKAILETVH
jgi:transposase